MPKDPTIEGLSLEQHLSPLCLLGGLKESLI